MKWGILVLILLTSILAGCTSKSQLMKVELVSVNEPTPMKFISPAPEEKNDTIVSKPSVQNQDPCTSACKGACLQCEDRCGCDKFWSCVQSAYDLASCREILTDECKSCERNCYDDCTACWACKFGKDSIPFIDYLLNN